MFQKSRNCLKILDGGWSTSMSYADDPQMLGAYVQNLVAKVIWHAGFLHPNLLLCIITVKNVCIYTYNFPASMAWY